MPEGELSKAEQALQAAGEAVVNDVVTTVRNHPQYAQIVNDLVDKTVAALLASI